ncbi:DNA damage-inducible protein 1 [Saitoella coloradoensis]
MQVLVTTPSGDMYHLDVMPSMPLEDMKVLVEFESGVTAAQQTLLHNSVELRDDKKTLEELGIKDNDMILLTPLHFGLAPQASSQTPMNDSEMMRLRMLGNAQTMQQLEQTFPEMADAARNNPTRFSQLLQEMQNRQMELERARVREMAALEADPFDVEAQRKIEEAIRQQAIAENLDAAMEHNPEMFGSVTLLYIPVEVNGTKVTAMVDSGAQVTVMSPDCAEKCGIMRLVDKRFAGVAKGVGTAKIIGRVHSAQIRVGDLFLMCSFTVMEGKNIDLLLGLDMLKRHQACIDLKDNALRIQDAVVPFLPESELPNFGRHEEAVEGQHGSLIDAESGAVLQPPREGSTNAVGSSTPSAAQSAPAPPQAASGSTGGRFPEESIKQLEALGFQRAQVIQALEVADGNVDVAAGILMQF